MKTHADVVAAAQTWLGCPYAHQQRMHGVAVDCAGLVIGVARQLGLVGEDFDISGYARIPDGHSLLTACEQLMTRIKQDTMQPGDVVVVKFDSEPQHFGILSHYKHGGMAMIHAAAKYGKVIETRLLFGTSHKAMKFVAAYRLPGVS